MDRRSFLTAKAPSMKAAAVNPGSLAFGMADTKRAMMSQSLNAWSPSANEPWDTQRIKHLYRRAGFGATHAELAQAKTNTPSSIVDAFLADAHLTNLPAPPKNSELWLEKEPYYGTELFLQTQQQNLYNAATSSVRRQWTHQMFAPQTMFREKMLLFWLNHFVIEANKVYYPQMMQRYMTYFRKHAWGNFKQMVKDVTIEPAMLLYLDGYISYRTRPNENYARELLELFTTGVTDKNGQPNYTEFDIREIARALTGYRIQFDAPAPNVVSSTYDITWHDASFKQPFGAKRENYGLASSGAEVVDVIDLIFEKRAEQIAWFMADKLYRFFIYANPTTTAEANVIDGIARSLIQNNWEVKPVLRELLLSQHFFATENIGAGIKSPFEYVVGMVRSFDIPVTDLQAGTAMMYGFGLEQYLLDPPNVKGWRGYHTWLSTTTLPLRNTAVASQLLTLKQLQAAGATGFGTEPHHAIAFSDADLLAWAKKFSNYTKSFDAFFDEVAEFLCAMPPSPNAKANLILPKLPPNYYEWPSLTDSEKLSPLRTIVRELLLLAEYQLN